jgi:hypothetical protein
MFSNGPKIITTGLSLLADASDQLSYPGAGNAWTDLITGTTASLSGSISFTTDYLGSLVTANSSSVIIFPPSTANFGTNTFTVEFAFRPSEINGQHWILSKNSGSFPNWGVYLTGSAGSGNLVAFFNISSAISCSLVSPTASITTGSNYIVDASLVPSTGISRLYINSETVATGSANGVGSLSATTPLFFSNLNSGSNSGTVNSVFNIKTYTPRLSLGSVRQNYNALGNRLGLSSKAWIAPVADSLLDLYPGAAVAYSLRQLSSDYGGYAIRVRNSSDQELDIGFNSSGELDTVTLLNHCGGGDGFVKTWYDQSGNGKDATQTTATNQPQIVSSGAIIYSGTKPTIVTTSNQRTLTATPLRSDSNGAASWFITYELNTLLRQGVVSWGDSLDTGINFEPGANNTGVLIHKYAAFAYGPDSSDWWSTDQDLFSWISPGGLVESSNLYLNSNLATSGFNFGSNANINFSSTLRIGAGSSASTSGLTSNISEIILYNLDQSSNRTAIETNTNDFYSIY